jgi:hypothetical protein
MTAIFIFAWYVAHGGLVPDKFDISFALLLSLLLSLRIHSCLLATVSGQFALTPPPEKVPSEQRAREMMPL